MFKAFLRTVAAWLLSFTYEKLPLDKLNQKLIRPVVREGNNLIIDGEQYFEFVNLSDMPEGRFAHFLDFNQEFTMGMDRETILDYCRQIQEATNKGNYSQVGALTWMLMDSVANCTPIESMYNLSSLFYFTKNEDLRCYDADINMRKIADFKKFKDQGFFLTRLLEVHLNISGDKLPEDTEAYLLRSAVKLAGYERIRSEMKGESA